MHAGMIHALRVSASADAPLFPASAMLPKTSGTASASTPMAMLDSTSVEPERREIFTDAIFIL
jgi:hypothetical protein